MSLLPLTYSGGDAILGDISFGRASGLAAAALKARVLLYAASPAYQSDRVVKLNGMGDYTIIMIRLPIKQMGNVQHSMRMR